MKKLLILTLILMLCGAAQAVVFEDNFDHVPDAGWARANYQGWYDGGAWSIHDWDGYISLLNPDGVQTTLVADNFVDTFNAGMGEAGKLQAWRPGMTGEVANGVLRMISSGSAWAGRDNHGPFLYKNIEGSFDAYVEVVGADHFWNNLGGLMARKDNPADPGTGEVDGANENWVYLTYFPVYSVGNHVRNTTNGSSPELGIKGYPCDPFLKLSRRGSTFYFETSPDGVTYTSLPGLEAGVSRPDMDGEVQIGIFQANYAGDWVGTMEFDNFVLIPEPATIALLGLGGLALIRRKR